MQKNAIIILIVLFVLNTPAPLCAQESHLFDQGRSAAPINTPLATLNELRQWHDAPLVWNNFPVLSAEILVDQAVTFSPTQEQMVLGAIKHGIRIKAGGSLTLANPNFILHASQEPAIIVEPGGQLYLQAGSLYTPARANAIVVEPGGEIQRADAFLIDGGQIVDNSQENTSPPEEPELPALIGTMGFDYALTCLAGQPPDPGAYPLTEWVTYLSADGAPIQVELPLQWALETVDFTVAGVYRVSGHFTADILAQYNLSNPADITSILVLTIIMPAPLDNLTGNLISIGSEGNALVRLTLPVLPEGVTALYLYRSGDGVNWEKAFLETYQNGHIPITYDDFWPYVAITPNALYVPYRYQTDYCPIWLKVEVVGSPVAGLSNPIQLKIPEGVKPGDSLHTGETGDDGGSGGNRGGGGQWESERELEPIQSKIPKESPERETSDILIPTEGSSKPEQSSNNVILAPILKSTTTGSAETPRPEQAPVSFVSSRNRAESTPAPMAEKEVSPSPQPPVASTAQEIAPFKSEPTIASAPKSKGVLITAGITALWIGGLLLACGTFKNPKKKP